MGQLMEKTINDDFPKRVATFDVEVEQDANKNRMGILAISAKR